MSYSLLQAGHLILNRELISQDIYVIAVLKIILKCINVYFSMFSFCPPPKKKKKKDLKILGTRQDIFFFFEFSTFSSTIPYIITCNHVFILTKQTCQSILKKHKLCVQIDVGYFWYSGLSQAHPGGKYLFRLIGAYGVKRDLLS